MRSIVLRNQYRNLFIDKQGKVVPISWFRCHGLAGHAMRLQGHVTGSVGDQYGTVELLVQQREKRCASLRLNGLTRKQTA
jgi:hypothetical protein